MINVYHQKFGDMWFAVGLEDDRVFATNFGSDESKVVKQLLQSLPCKMPFRMAEKSNQPAEKMLATVNSVYGGEDVTSDFKLEMSHMPSYSRKVLSVR